MRRMNIVLMAAILLACNSGEPDELRWDDYRTWLSDNDAIKKDKKGKFVDISTVFVPVDLLIYRDMATDESYYEGPAIDSLRVKYEESLTFEVSIVANDAAINLLWFNANGYPEYQARVNHLSFHSEDLFQLTAGEEDIHPVLTHFEGYNELSNKIVFHVVFENSPIENLDSDAAIRLTFEDMYWGSGTNHFTYMKKDLTETPKLIFG